MNFMKSKQEPRISDENVVSEFISAITLTNTRNFKTQGNKNSHKYFYFDYMLK